MSKKQKKEQKRVQKELRMAFYDQYAMTHGYAQAKSALDARDKVLKASGK